MGCSGKNPVLINSIEPFDYLPLAIGNSWVYNEISDSNISTEHRYKIYDKEIYFGREWYKYGADTTGNNTWIHYSFEGSTVFRFHLIGDKPYSNMDFTKVDPFIDFTMEEGESYEFFECNMEMERNTGYIIYFRKTASVLERTPKTMTVLFNEGKEDEHLIRFKKNIGITEIIYSNIKKRSILSSFNLMENK